MGTITILPETTKNPITLMGQRAEMCIRDRQRVLLFMNHMHML